MKKYNIAIVGATGAVGETMLEILAERNFPINNLRLLASERSAGKKYSFRGNTIEVETLDNKSFQNIDFALFSAGGDISREFAPVAVKSGAVVIDNSSAFRMDPDVPLIIPEVNPLAAFKHKGIIANPNCTTIILLVALKPLHDYAKINRVTVATYQSASGAGARGIEELIQQNKDKNQGRKIKAKIFSHQLLHNVIPHVDIFQQNGYTKEEMKMFNETRKIMNDDNIRVSSTCVRVPVLTAHSEAVTIDTEKVISPEKAIELLDKAAGVEVLDYPQKNLYPMPLTAAGKDNCFVGRIRKDLGSEHGLSFWICGDQLRKGAALNAIQIAELLIRKD